VTVRDVVTAALAAAGIGLQVFACAGVVLMRDAFDRLHYAGASVPGVTCVCAAVVVSAGPSLIGLKTILTAAFLIASGPVLGHATARAIFLHREARR
jgi:multisubunit Na+/H+ antiporter MnhG subunit